MRVFGGFTLLTAAGGTVGLSNRKAAGLLAYLAIGQKRSETRDQLAGLLWSDFEEERARASLRQSLKQLRDALSAEGAAVIEARRASVDLAPDTVVVDLLDVADALSRGRVPPALAEGRCDPQRILYGYEELDQSFAAWLSVTRQAWTDRMVRDLDRLLVQGGATRAVGLDAARALLAIDPTHEGAQRRLIAHHADGGNIAAALRQYNDLWELLAQDFDMEPAEETQRLIARIKAGTYGALVMPAPAPADPVPHAQGRAVIGVAPFVKGGPWDMEDASIEGFRREVLAALVRFREWIVVDGVRPTSGDPGREGGADYHLEGTYYQDGEAVRLIITLKERATGHFVWSDRTVLTESSWFEAQEQIIRKLASTLNRYLSAERLSQLVRPRAMSHEAHVKWLRGYHNLTLWTPENERKAEAIFKEIIEETPDFAPAYGGLTSVLNSRHFKHPGRRRDPAEAAEALRLSQRAVELDPLDTRAQLALAFSYAMNGRFEPAELHFNLVLELNPFSPITLVPCAHGLSYCGRHAEATRLSATAIEMNPMMPGFHWGYILCIRYLARDFAGAVEAAELAQGAIPDLHGWHAAALAKDGRLEEAAEVAHRFVEEIGRRWEGVAAPTDREVTAWFLHCFPIKLSEDVRLLREGLERAGLPVD